MTNQYEWIPFYEEFADKLLGFYDKRDELFEIVRELSEKESFMNYLHFEREDWWGPRKYHIDPFSVMATFNRGTKNVNRTALATTFAEILSMQTPVPEEFDGIPIVDNRNSFFGDSEDGILWDLFAEALKLSEGKDSTEDFERLFDKAGNGLARITSGLYWIRPNDFMPLDSNSRKYISNTFGVDINFNTITGDEYISLLKELKDATPQSFPEIAYTAWMGRNDLHDEPINYSPDISAEKWVEILSDPDVFQKQSLEIMKRFKDFGGSATCTQLANEYGELKNFYSRGSSALAERVHKRTDCPVYKENDKPQWWRILYTGGQVNDPSIEGSTVWKLRDELNQALDRIDLSEVSLYSNTGVIREEYFEPMTYSKKELLEEVFISEEDYDILANLLKRKKNIILQGAPGVGKTFLARRLAYSLMGKKDDNRIGFVQFHQNYTYEDFVMGYKPEGNSFILKSGKFVEFCRKAQQDSERDYFFIIDEINRGNISKIFGELLMAIETDYRGIPIELAYDSEDFTVPKNVHVIGMMNTADRSLAMIDYALRRRFSFFEMHPGFESSGFRKYQAALNSDDFNRLIDVVRGLNNSIIDEPSLGSGFQIGNSYFILDAYEDTMLTEIVNYEIVPMLNEYWFDDQVQVDSWYGKLNGAIQNG